MSESARVEWDAIGQGLRFGATVGTDHPHHLAFDSGEGAVAANPVQTLLAALGACHAMDVISILRKKRQQVTAYALELEGDRRTEHPRSFTRITIVHRLTGHEIQPTAVEEAIRLTDTKYCSVHFSMDPRIEITSRFEIVAA